MKNYSKFVSNVVKFPIVIKYAKVKIIRVKTKRKNANLGYGCMPFLEKIMGFQIFGKE